MDTILLTLSIISGQLLKFSIGTHGGLTLLDITVIILCLLGLWHTKLRLLKTPLWMKASFVFILIALLSLILTPITLTQAEYFTSISYIIRFSLYIFLGWLVYSNAFPNLKKNTHHILFISGSILAVLGLLQIIFLPDLQFLEKFGWDPHYFRTASTFLDPNFLGSYLVLTLILLTQNLKFVKKWKIFLFVIIYIALLTTFSRGAYLAFLISFLTFSVIKKSIKLAIVTLLLFFTLLLGFQIYQEAVTKPRGIDRTQSAEFRLETWQQGWQLFQMHSILGIGFNTYRYALRQYNLGGEEFLQSHGASTNDSSLLYVAATTGVIGLISYIFLLGAIFVTGVKLHPPLAAGLLGLITQSFFANTLFYPFLLIWLILITSQTHDTTYST